MSYPPDFKPLNALLSQWFEQRKKNPAPLPQELIVVWTQITGPILARYSRPVKWMGHTLDIEASSEAWAEALAAQRQFLLRQLKTRLPKLPIRDIRFSIQGNSTKPNLRNNHLIQE